ncbi:hypothetical protein EJB05_02377, partial [Eragrostis curvula]
TLFPCTPEPVSAYKRTLSLSLQFVREILVVSVTKNSISQHQRFRSHRQESNNEFNSFPNYPTRENKRVHDAKHNISMSEEQNQSKCSPDSVESCTNGNCPTPAFPDADPLRRQLIEAKRARNRAYYASMTLEQRQVRCERQRMQYALRSTLRKKRMQKISATYLGFACSCTGLSIDVPAYGRETLGAAAAAAPIPRPTARGTAAASSPPRMATVPSSPPLAAPWTPATIEPWPAVWRERVASPCCRSSASSATGALPATSAARTPAPPSAP